MSSLTNLMVDTDFKELIAGCIAGNEEAWDQFMELFHPLIYGSVKKVFKRNSTDTAQVVYENLIDQNFRLLRQFRGTYEQFILYLKQISEYLAMKAMKKSYTQDYRELLVENFEDFDKTSGESLEESTIEKERWEEIKVAMARLPAKYQKVLELRLKGVSHKQIAEILHIPLSTSLTWSSRAMRSMKKIV